MKKILLIASLIFMVIGICGKNLHEWTEQEVLNLVLVDSSTTNLHYYSEQEVLNLVYSKTDSTLRVRFDGDSLKRLKVDTLVVDSAYIRLLEVDSVEVKIRLFEVDSIYIAIIDTAIIDTAYIGFLEANTVTIDTAYIRLLETGSVTSNGNVEGLTYGSDGSVTNAELLYINTLSRNAQDQITENVDSLADHRTDINTNSTNITVNVDSLVDHRTAIDLNSTNVTVNVDSLVDHRTAIDLNSTNITVNVDSLVDHRTAIDLNSTNVTVNVDTSSVNDAWGFESTAISAYTIGMNIYVSIAVANTIEATLQINTLGAKAVHKLHDQALVTGDVEVGQILHLIYDGVEFQMLSQLAQ